MPPALLSEEEQSDIGEEVALPTKSTNHEIDLGEDDEDAQPDLNGDAPDDDDDDNDEQGDEDVFVVEKILNHRIDPKDGEPRFEVLWEGYPDEADHTWEPEENLLDGGSEILAEYYQSVGGREKIFEETKTAMRSKKRSRPSSGTPTATLTKRSKRNGEHPADGEPPMTVKEAPWKPPMGSWEDHIAQVDAAEDEKTGKLMFYLTWMNNQKTQHETKVVYQRCPQKILRYYESHVRIVKRKDEDEGVKN